MTIKKDWYKSKTIVVLLPMVLYHVAKLSWIEVPETEVFAALESWTSFAIAAIAIYGRFGAKTQIK